MTVLGILSRRPKRSTIPMGRQSGSSLGTVGPLAMAVNGSPTTSDRISEITVHSPRTNPISLPPLTRDRAFLTVLSCSMDAPPDDNRLVARILSWRGTVGEHNSAEPPPDISTISKSCLPRRASVPVMRSVFSTDCRSGMLFLAASMTRTLEFCKEDGRWVPNGTLTTASLRRPLSMFSTSSAMLSTALPKPTT